MIQRVYEQVKGVLDDAYVATDDERIEEAVRAFGGKVVMTSVNHKSGTDRCYEAYCKVGHGFDVVVNIQGDEPFIQRSQLEAVKACFDDGSTQIATLVKPFSPADGYDALENVNSPKVVVKEQEYVMAGGPLFIDKNHPLRWLENGYSVKVGVSEVETIGIDTPEDLARAEEFLRQHQELR